MTIYFGPVDLSDRIDPQFALQAMHRAFDTEAAGDVQVATRIDVPSRNGFIRVMPAVLGDVMGVKVMTLVRGVGTRYLVLLFDVRTGDLLAAFDADELTRWRTAATTAVAALSLVPEPPTEIGLVGTGFEAVGELRALADLWELDRARVFSPHVQRRNAFCERMAAELGIEVVPEETRRAVCTGQKVVVLATKATAPVVDGDDFDEDTVVLSIGSTRPDLREMDRQSFARARVVVADDPAQLVIECGDVADAVSAGVLDERRIIALARLRSGATVLPEAVPGSGEIALFKSVGTALQDLALADAVYRRSLLSGEGRDLGELVSLKAFAGSPTTTPESFGAG